MSDLVHLQKESLTAVISPGIGGAVVRLRYGDLDILRPTPAKAVDDKLVRQMASYPLVPYSNRIVNARLKVGSREFALSPNFAPEPHAIHGVGWRRAWITKAASPTHLHLALNHEPDADWPFHFAAHQRFELGARSLRVELGLLNTGNTPMPAGMGFHPFFPRPEETTLETRWQGYWTMSDHKVPQEHRQVPAEADFSNPRLIGAWRTDNCYTGWSRKAVLGHATHCTELVATEGFGHCVCFVPADNRPFIALEPVSHVVDAFNLAAAGRKDTGTRMLAPGQSWTEAMTIRVLERMA